MKLVQGWMQDPGSVELIRLPLNLTSHQQHHIKENKWKSSKLRNSWVSYKLVTHSWTVCVEIAGAGGKEGQEKGPELATCCITPWQQGWLPGLLACSTLHVNIIAAAYSSRKPLRTKLRCSASVVPVEWPTSSRNAETSSHKILFPRLVSACVPMPWAKKNIEPGAKQRYCFHFSDFNM